MATQSFTLDPSGQSLVLSAVSSVDGGTPTLYADAGLSTAVSIPAVVSSVTTFYHRELSVAVTVTQVDGTVLVSAAQTYSGQTLRRELVPSVAALAADVAALPGTYGRIGLVLGGRAPAPQVLALPTPLGVPPTRALGSAPTGGATLDATAATSLVRFGGGRCAILATAGGDGWRNMFGYTETSSSSVYFVEFDFYGQDLAVRFRDNLGSNLAATWLWVDGVPATKYQETMGANSVGNILNWYVNFGSIGRRRLRIYFYDCDFAGFVAHPTAMLRPVPASQPKIGLYGDSWVFGANSTKTTHTWLYSAALMLGMEPWPAGQGGTGYVCTTADARLGAYGDSRRTAAIDATTSLDYLAIVGSVNDDVNASPTPAQITAAATAFYAARAVSMPSTKLIVFGVQSVGTHATGDGLAARIANNNAVKAAAQAAPNVLGFIDMIGGQWMTGTGHIGATTGDGPADYLMDSAYHMGQDGHDTLAARAAAEIAHLLTGAI